MAQYKDGTVSVTQNSNVVNLAGNTADATGVAVGDWFKVDIDGAPIYQVASRAPASGPSLTSITLSTDYAGPTQSGLACQIVKDFSPNRNYVLFAQGDSDAADWLTKLVTQIDQDMGALLAQGAAPLFGTAALRTATGSSSSSLVANGFVRVTMNDYSFFPNIQNISNVASLGISPFPTPSDAGDTVGQLLVQNTGASAYDYVIRWRYVTGSDAPRIWVIADGAGTIQHVWASDDPTGNDITTPVEPHDMTGLTVYKFGSADMQDLAALATTEHTALAKEWIKNWGYSQANLSYRQLQRLAHHLTDLTPSISAKPTPEPRGFYRPLPAPAAWIHQHAKIDVPTGRLVPK